ncbi:MAG: D-cysteine desulfhydrase [Bacillariaceae sp.]|jgi:1-aminocyclopropane-1-carboxylate deaminase/D-cysteine desulfhydrase-like pyridoxal-dependent ACC family enzyme
MHQLDSCDEKIDHVVFASGSGGTAAGISLGLTMAYHQNENMPGLPKIHAVGVCDDPDYFYDTITTIAKEMGIDVSSFYEFPEGKIKSYTSIEDFVRNHLIVHQGKGQGYASSTAEELDFIIQFAVETGICLDPVYSGKALYQFMKDIEENPDSYRDSRIVFWHTGGSLGNFEKIEALRAKLRSVSPVKRLDVYGRK